VAQWVSVYGWSASNSYQKDMRPGINKTTHNKKRLLRERDKLPFIQMFCMCNTSVRIVSSGGTPGKSHALCTAAEERYRRRGGGCGEHELGPIEWVT
jgi:hypothetical protein